MPSRNDGVSDRWHRSRPKPGEAVCPEHGGVPTKEHGVGMRWLVRYRLLSGKQESVSVWDEPPAGEPGGYDYAAYLAAEVRSAKYEGRDPDLPSIRRNRAVAALRVADSSVPTVAEYIPQFLAQEGREDSTIENYESRLRLYVADSELGPRPLNEVKRGEVKRYFAGLKEDGIPDSTRRSTKIALSALFAAALDDDEYELVANPVHGVKVPYEPVRKKVELTWADVNRFVQGMPARYRFLVWMGAILGLRPMEAAAVTTDAFVVRERRLYVVKQHRRGELRPKMKTPRSRDYVVMGDFLIDQYHQHMADHRQRPTPQELGQRERRGRKPIPEESWKLITATSRYTPVAKSTLEGYVAVARAKAGLHEDTGFRHLRHFMDALLIHSGVEPRGVQARMRHARLDETLNTYGYFVDGVDWENAPASFAELYGIPEPEVLPAAARIPAAERANSPVTVD